MMNDELIEIEEPIIEGMDLMLLLEEEILEEPGLIEDLDYPETPATDPIHDYQSAPKKYTNDQDDAVEVTMGAYTDTEVVKVKLVTPSDVLKDSDDTEETNDHPSYTEDKELDAVTVNGKIKIKFDLRKETGGTASGFGKIYINDVAIGDEHENTTDSYVTYEDTDIDVVSGDLIQLRTKTTGNKGVVIRNFRIYWDVSTKDYVDNKVATFASGRAIRAGDAASGDQAIAHGLSGTPTFIKIKVLKYVGTTSNFALSEGTYDGTNMAHIYVSTNTSGGNAAGGTTKIISIQDNGSGTAQTASVVVDATNITLTWTKAGTPNSNQIEILWEAQI